MAARPNKDAPAAVDAAPGHGTELEGSMQTQPTSSRTGDAVDALHEAVRHGQHAVEVACGECLEELFLIDRRAAGYPSGPMHPSSDVVLAHDGHDDEDLARCPGCSAYLASDTVILRDRHGRCAQALADDCSDGAVSLPRAA